MKFKGLLIAGTALTMALGMAAMVGCGGSGTDYTFEAEKAQLSQNADGVAVYQSATEYSANGEGAAVELVGYFTAADASIVWKITSDKECDATLTLRAASASSDMSSWTIKEMDLSTDTYATLDVNGTKAKMEGKLPGLTFTPAEDFSNMMDFFGSYMNNYAEVTAKIHLKAGENTITLKSLGYTETPEGAQMPISYGMNVDKITIKAPATLTWTETDNTSRVPAMG